MSFTGTLRSEAHAKECSAAICARTRRSRHLAVSQDSLFRTETDRRQLWWLIELFPVELVEFAIHSAPVNLRHEVSGLCGFRSPESR